MTSDRREPGIDTLAIREGIERTAYLEHNEPIFLTSSFVFENAAQAAARFAGDEPGFIYSRAGNPTVTAFQNRLAALEGARTVAPDHLRRMAAPALRHRLRRNPLDDAGSTVRVDRAVAEEFAT